MVGTVMTSTQHITTNLHQCVEVARVQHLPQELQVLLPVLEGGLQAVQCS